MAVAAALLIGACASSPARATKICAYAIPATMVDRVDSRDARPGGEFRFRVTQLTQLDSGLVIPAGTVGYGVVRAVDAAGRHNHNGSLALEPRYLLVRTRHGVDRVAVTMNPTLPAVWTPSTPLLAKAASRVPLPVPGLAMTAINTIRWGRNVTLGPGFSFSVLPVGNLARGPVC